MKIVAFLQNQWFKDPTRARAMIASGTTEYGPDYRTRFLTTTLFMGCLTGRRLKKAFGEDRCRQIIWEEASPEIGGKSASAFPADPAHMSGIIRTYKPHVVLTFGRIATDALPSVIAQLKPAKLPVMDPLETPVWEFQRLVGPHPAARHGTVCQELAAMAGRLQEIEEEIGPWLDTWPGESEKAVPA